MEGMTIRDMRREAVRALTEYRRMKGRLLALAAAQAPLPGKPAQPVRPTARLRRQEPPATPEEAARMTAWVEAIEAARAALREEYPLKERLMARCFGLDVAAPRGQDARTRLVKLSMDLHVATSTLYKWREDAVDLTLYGAIEAGALRPYGIARMQPDAARAEAGGAQG